MAQREPFLQETETFWLNKNWFVRDVVQQVLHNS